MPTRNHLSLHEDQTDASLHHAWLTQEGICPSCEEEIPWHRGVLHKSGDYRLWKCMLCSLLDSALQDAPTHVEQAWEEQRDHVPIPPGYRIIWVHSEWVLKTAKFRHDDRIDVARLLGNSATRQIWAATHEDSRVASRKPWNPEEGCAVPVLIKEHDIRNLGAFIGSQEEFQTRTYIHDHCGLNVNLFKYADFSVAGSQRTLPCITSELLGKIRKMSPTLRRTSVPRLGVVDPQLWEDIKKAGESPLGIHVKTVPTDDGKLVYFASIRDCVSLYDLPGKSGLCQDYANMTRKVGYDFGVLANPNAASGVYLWDRVFGFDLFS